VAVVVDPTVARGWAVEEAVADLEGPVAATTLSRCSFFEHSLPVRQCCILQGNLRCQTQTCSSWSTSRCRHRRLKVGRHITRQVR
jgi:hypothetical protein